MKKYKIITTLYHEGFVYIDADKMDVNSNGNLLFYKQIGSENRHVNAGNLAVYVTKEFPIYEICFAFNYDWSIAFEEGNT